ncbi:hypothetical protein [Bacillus sp. 2205SS5-2]|uniref:hypothetical protein n=1 Tax=Bacillus sp. 2205SS5-2 TaxID=3109031 RepID=UPI003006D4B4
MKRYFKWHDDDFRGSVYIETDERVALKQITVTPDKYIVSNREDKEHHFFLGGGLIDPNEVFDYGGSEICESQF